MKLDLLAIVAHPDDAELGAGGTLRAHVENGYKVGICDLTEGQLGTRGTPELRQKEAARSAEILGLSVRENLHLMDFFFYNVQEHQEPIVQVIRKYKPEIVLANTLEDRHPDHGKAAKLVSDACFLAGLRAFKTSLDGEEQEAWRPKNVYHMIQDHYHKPDIVVDITAQYQKKMDAIKAFSSQFYDPSDKSSPETPISTPDFMYFLDARAREMGRIIKAQYGEGFQVVKAVGVTDLFPLK